MRRSARVPERVKNKMGFYWRLITLNDCKTTSCRASAGPGGRVGTFGRPLAVQDKSRKEVAPSWPGNPRVRVYIYSALRMSRDGAGGVRLRKQGRE